MTIIIIIDNNYLFTNPMYFIDKSAFFVYLCCFAKLTTDRPDVFEYQLSCSFSKIAVEEW